MRHTFLALALVPLACGGTGSDLTDAERSAIRAEVEQVMRDAYDMSQPNAAARMLSLYPESGRVVSANTGRAITSLDTLKAGIREFWDYVGVNMRDPTWEWGAIWVDVLSRDAAVATATYRIPHRNPNNQAHVLGGAMTMVFQKRGGRWVVIQEHLSDTPQGQDTTTGMIHDHH